MSIGNVHRDTALFARIAGEDAAAFRELFELYFNPLRFNAFKILKSEYWAEEVAQEVLLQVWDNKGSLAGIENPAGWMYRITANKCFDRSRRLELELRAQYAIHLTLAERNNPVAQAGYDLTLLKKIIHDAVERLPEQQKIVYTLRQEEELSYKEIAEKLGISLHTVRNHLVKAFQSVRSYVLSHGGFQALHHWFVILFLNFFIKASSSFPSIRL